MGKHLQPKRLGRTMGAIAALASALSVVTGLIAARAGPHGFARLKIALHLAHEPFVVKLAAGIAAVAVTAATIAGLLHFYVWWQEREVEEPADESKPAADARSRSA